MSTTRCRTVLTAGAVAALVVFGLVLNARAGAPGAMDAWRAVAVCAPLCVLGVVVIWNQPQNKLGLVIFGLGALFGLEPLLAGVLRDVSSGHDIPWGVPRAAYALLWLAPAPALALVSLALLLFPDGRFPGPRWKRWFVASTAVHVMLNVAAFLTAGASELPALLLQLHSPVGGPLTWGPGHRVLSTTATVVGLLLVAVALLALVGRVRAAGPVVRQQGKWLLSSVAFTLTVQLLVPATLDPWRELRLVAQVLELASPTLMAVAVGHALLHHRLWEIDLVLSRTLLFGVLSAAITVAFFGVAFVAGLVVGHSDGRLVAALALVLVTVLVAERLRWRVEALVRRLVYGDRPEGYAVMRTLANALAQVPDGTAVLPIVTDTVCQGLAVPWAGLWLQHTDQRWHLAAASGMDEPPVDLPACVADRLALSTGALLIADLDDASTAVLDRDGPHPAAVAPVTGAPFGVIACGERPGDPLGPRDLQLLDLVAREATLALVRGRLEAQLRLHVAALRSQADELRQSRERLVRAQTDERRRIERDLHDGAQARLVAVATRIRLLAGANRTTGSYVREELRSLAAEAEDAVFALQDLARGIYPSLLTDRGLVSALRAEAARVALDTRLVDELPDGERLPPDVEGAFYFVALEALGNAQKHAPSARVVIRVVLDDEGCGLVVEDDGPGLGAEAPVRPGGLQNMVDRMAAVGGTLRIDSRASGGTRVVARVARPPIVGLPPGPWADVRPADPVVSARVPSSAGTAAPPPPGG
jgi:signal transduction histidine kinase